MKYGSVVGVSKPVSRVALGTMIINTREYEQSCKLLDAAMSLGCSTLDTAYVYAGGDSERAIGKWMKDRGNREQVVVLTKGCHHNQDRKRVTPFDISADLHDSLARLQTSYVDIYLLHRDDVSVPVGPIVDALNEHHRAGRIRAFGGSNWTHERMQQANDYAKSKNLIPFTASSPNFSLAEQVNDPWGPGCVTISGPQQEAARTWYRSTNMPMFAYSSLARGLLSGRVSRANFETTKQQLDEACRHAYCHEVNFQRLDRVEQLAKEKGVTVPQLSMAWIMNQPLNAFALVGAANEQELSATIAGAELKLSTEDCAWLDLKSATRAAKG